MTRNRHILATLARLASAEREFLRGRFVAAVARGQSVRTRIGDARCTLRVVPDDFEGIGVFAPTGMSHARLVRPASASERRAFLDSLTPVRMVLLRRQGDVWRAIPAQADVPAHRRPVAVRLVEACFLFDSILARSDGQSCWFDMPDPGPALIRGDRLRQALAGMISPSALTLKHLTPQQRAAYEIVYHYRLNLRRRLARQRTGRR